MTVAVSASSRRAFDFNALLSNITVAPGVIGKYHRRSYYPAIPGAFDRGLSVMG